MSKSYTFSEAQKRADELTKRLGPASPYDHVRTVATSTGPDGRVEVEVRRKSDHTKWDKV